MSSLPRFADLTEETTLDLGVLSNITLLGSVPGCNPFYYPGQTFDVGNDQIAFCVREAVNSTTGVRGPNWFTALGTLIVGNVLRVDSILSSSNAGAPVSFPPGIKEVFSTLPASILNAIVAAALGGGTTVPAVPVNATVPTITGSYVVGQVLTAAPGSWTGSPTSYAYAWYRNGTAITGATTSTYTLVSADAGTSLTVRVIATNATGPSASAAISNGTPTITGTDTTAPVESTAAVANASPTVVTVTFSEAMDQTSVPAASAFTVSGHTVSSVAFSNSTVLLVTVSAAFVNGEAARTLAYTQPGTGNLKDLAGNLLASFSAAPITNNVAAPVTDTRPRFGTGAALAGTNTPAALLASMTDIAGSSNGGKVGGPFTVNPGAGQYGWAAFLTSAVGSGVVFTSALGQGDWNGAASAGNFTGLDVTPTTSSITYNDGTNSWTFFRMSSANVSYTGSIS